MKLELCHFSTDRLLVQNWHAECRGEAGNDELARIVQTILTPPVTAALPGHWQGEYTAARAAEFVAERDSEGNTLMVIEQSSHTLIGLLILFANSSGAGGREVRLGYLLAESAWGKGFATELVQGFVAWCKAAGGARIIAGVGHDNVASQRVLEKSGFVVLAGSGK